MTMETGYKMQRDMLIEVDAYSRGWANMMVEIWQHRIETYHAIDTRSLFQSVRAFQPLVNGISAEFKFTFNHYGVHVEHGVGNGYYHGNGGDLPFLGDEYRELHGLNRPRRSGPAIRPGMSSGRPRERREWFSPSWWYSRRVIGEKMVEFVGDAYVGLFDNLNPATP